MALTKKQQHDANRANREPTAEDMAAYLAAWPNPGRHQSEIDYFIRTRRHRKPGDSGYDGRRGITSRPPLDSSYRCQGTTRVGKRAGQRCIQWACKGARFCRFHGGFNRYSRAYVAKNKVMRKKRDRESERVGKHAEQLFRNLQRLPAVYSKYLSDSLANRLEDLLKRPLREQINAAQELGLIEIAATDAIQLYDVTYEETQKQLEQLETLDSGTIAKATTIADVLQMRVAAGSIMKDTLVEVMNAREQVQRMALDKRTAIAVQDLALIVAQFVEIAYECFGDIVPIELMSSYAERVRNIKLPRDGSEGTMLTPDMDVAEMDRTVPKIA